MFNKKFIMFITMIICILGLMITPICAVYTNPHNVMVNPTNNHTNQINESNLYKIPLQEAYFIAANKSKNSPYKPVATVYHGQKVIYGVPVYEFNYVYHSKEVGVCDISIRDGTVVKIQWVYKSDENKTEIYT